MRRRRRAAAVVARAVARRRPARHQALTVRAALRFAALETTVPVAIALTEVAVACGSSSVPWLRHTGRDARWVLLFVLVASAAALFAVRVAWSRARPFALAGWLVALAGASAIWSVAPGLT